MTVPFFEMVKKWPFGKVGKVTNPTFGDKKGHFESAGEVFLIFLKVSLKLGLLVIIKSKFFWYEFLWDVFPDVCWDFWFSFGDFGD